MLIIVRTLCCLALCECVCVPLFYLYVIYVGLFPYCSLKECLNFEYLNSDIRMLCYRCNVHKTNIEAKSKMSPTAKTTDRDTTMTDLQKSGDPWRNTLEAFL